MTEGAAKGGFNPPALDGPDRDPTTPTDPVHPDSIGHPPRFTAAELVKDGAAHVGIGRAVLVTLWDLLRRPGRTLERCLHDRARSPYVGPIPFLLPVMAVWWLAWTVVPPSFVGEVEVPPDSMGLELLMEYGALLSCLSVIPLALGTRVVLSDLDLSLTEHVVANAYVWAAGTLLVLLFFPLFHASFGFWILWAVSSAVISFYHPYAFSQLGEAGFPRRFPRSLLATVVGQSLLLLPLAFLLFTQL